jgi:hypothetical protein
MYPDYECPGSDRADVCLKGEVDVDGMVDDARAEAFFTWTDFHEVVAGTAPLFNLEEAKSRVGVTGVCSAMAAMDTARTLFFDQPAIILWKNKRPKRRDESDFFDDMALPLEDYQDLCGKRSITTFAYIKDGEWRERGWGARSSEKEGTRWDAEFWEMWRTIPDEAQLTVVDCHI